jgi:hypothetical protein
MWLSQIDISDSIRETLVEKKKHLCLNYEPRTIFNVDSTLPQKRANHGVGEG